jgi:dTDP-4-dehydrorhamnose 3,5-epimerase
MGLKLISEYLNGLKLFETNVFGDERGFFMESWRADEFEELGLPTNFVQDNHSRSIKDTIRGMHFQWNQPQGKLIRVTLGEAMVVEIDIKHNSPTLGKFEKFLLSAENKRVLWVPAGFANGFITLSDWCELQYKCTALYNPQGESAIRWNDPAIGIDWGCRNPVISEKDKNAGNLQDWLNMPVSGINW